MIVRIDDPDDHRIEGYRAVRDRDLNGRGGLFMLEGRVVLEKAIAACPEQIVSVLVAAPRLSGLSDVIAGLPAETPVLVAAQPVMDRVVGFPIHRGVLALGRRRERRADELLAGLAPQAAVMVLCGIANHDNMGGLFRNAAAFGAAAVLLDPQCCDPLYRKAVRVSVGGVLTVPHAQLGPGEDLLSLLSTRGLTPIALSPRGATALNDFRFPDRCALIFGAEGPGLPDAILDRAETLRIAMAGGFDSLNVATTSGIVMHAWAVRAKSVAP